MSKREDRSQIYKILVADVDRNGWKKLKRLYIRTHMDILKGNIWASLTTQIENRRFWAHCMIERDGTKKRMSRSIRRGFRGKKGKKQRKWRALQRNGLETEDSDGQWAAPTPEPKTQSDCRKSVTYPSPVSYHLLFSFSSIYPDRRKVPEK